MCLVLLALRSLPRVLQVPGTAESARSCVRAYFADLHETLCRQEEMALSVVDAHVRERLIWLRQQQEDMTILLSQVSTACLHCEKTLQQVGDESNGDYRSCFFFPDYDQSCVSGWILV